MIAIQNAFIKVNNLAYEQHLSLIDEYFDKNGNPYYITIKVPYENINNAFDKNSDLHTYNSRELNIPKISLVPINTLKFDEIEVDLKVRLVGKITLKELDSKNNDKEVNDNESKKRSLLKKSNVILSKEEYLGYIP